MKLEVLPRAEQWFKQKIDMQIEKLIEESENLSKKYLGKREEVIQKMSCGIKARRKIEILIRILEQALTLSPQARAIMEEVKGMEVQQIQDMLYQLREILKSAQHQASNIAQQNGDFGARNLQDDDEESIAGINEEGFQETNTNKTYIRFALQTMEVFCCTSSIIAIVYFVSQQFLL